MAKKKKGARIKNDIESESAYEESSTTDDEDLSATSKQARTSPFTKEEVERLLSLTEVAKENDKNGGISWEYIEREFNSTPLTETYRSAKNLKIKYKNFMRNLRKELKSSTIEQIKLNKGLYPNGTLRLARQIIDECKSDQRQLPPFTKVEVERLLSLTEPNNECWKDGKIYWKYIEREFNSIPLTETYRIAKQLRKKYYFIKLELREKLKSATIEQIELNKRLYPKGILRLARQIIDERAPERRQSPPFTKEEVERLLSLTETTKEYDKNGGISWEYIEREFNSKPLIGKYRNAKVLAKKYKSLKLELRKKLKSTTLEQIELNKGLYPKGTLRLARQIIDETCKPYEERRPAPPYTKEEVERLLSLAETTKGSHTDGRISWKCIEREFNSIPTETYRSGKHLLYKYNDIKREFRKKINNTTSEQIELNEELYPKLILGLRRHCKFEPRFTKDEVERLLSLTVATKEENGTISWECIEQEFNSTPLTETYRSAVYLLKKYHGIKTELRKKLRNTTIEQMELNKGLYAKGTLRLARQIIDECKSERRQSLPFTKKEVERLLSLTEEAKENDKNGGISWEYIEREFNSTPLTKTYRSAKVLRKRYNYIRLKLRKKLKNTTIEKIELNQDLYPGGTLRLARRIIIDECEPVRTKYTDKEHEKLLSLIEPRVQMIENGERGEVQNKAWKDIVREFNKINKRQGKGYCQALALRTKYSNWKKNLRTKLRATKYKEVELNPFEEKLKEMLKKKCTNKSNPQEHDNKDSDGADEGNDKDDAGDNNRSHSEGARLSLVNEDDKKRLSLTQSDSDAADDSDCHDDAAGTDGNDGEVSDHAGRPRTPREILSSVELNSPHMEVGSSYEPGGEHFVIHNTEQKSTFDKLLTEKTEVVTMQKQLIEDEIKEKKLKAIFIKEENEMKKEIQQLERNTLECHLDILKREREHKKEMFELEKQEALLRRQVLKRKLQFFQETEEC